MHTTPEIAAKHDTLMPLLRDMARNFADFARKKPDATLSKQKVEIVNRLLRDILVILQGEPTASYLDLLDNEVLPQNSDVVLVLGQFVVAMERFAARYQRKADDMFADLAGQSDVSWITMPET